MRRPRFSIRLTQAGAIFTLLCLLVGIAGLNTGNNLIYLVFAMMLSFIVLSGILSNNTLSYVRVAPNITRRAFAQDHCKVNLGIQNNKRWFPSYSLLIQPQSKDHSHIGNYVVKIPPKQEANSSCQIYFAKRGIQPIPDIRLETSYPFGIIRKYLTYTTQEDAVVYPKLLDIDFSRHEALGHLGAKLSQQKGSSDNTYGLREFAFGDSYKRIHWKSSAKLNKLHIREFEKETKEKIHLFLSLPESETLSDTAEIAVSYCASILKFTIGRELDTQLWINQKLIPNKTQSLDVFLQALAAYPNIDTDESKHTGTLENAFTIYLDGHSNTKTVASANLSLGEKDFQAFL